MDAWKAQQEIVPEQLALQADILDLAETWERLDGPVTPEREIFVTKRSRASERLAPDPEPDHENAVKEEKESQAPLEQKSALTWSRKPHHCAGVMAVEIAKIAGSFRRAAQTISTDRGAGRHQA